MSDERDKKLVELLRGMGPEHVMMVVNLLLEDVAEDPTRLHRAMEIAERDIKPVLEAMGRVTQHTIQGPLSED